MHARVRVFSHRRIRTHRGNAAECRKYQQAVRRPRGMQRHEYRHSVSRESSVGYLLDVGSEHPVQIRPPQCCVVPRSAAICRGVHRAGRRRGYGVRQSSSDARCRQTGQRQHYSAAAAGQREYEFARSAGLFRKRGSFRRESLPDLTRFKF